MKPEVFQGGIPASAGTMKGNLCVHAFLGEFEFPFVFFCSYTVFLALPLCKHRICLLKGSLPVSMYEH